MANDISRVLAAAVAADPARPLLTWYDDATGDRAELSGATCANWVAKTANLLVDSAGLTPGDRAGVLLPPHWQTAAVLLGCWSAQVSVAIDGPSTTGISGTGPGPVEVVFAATDRIEEATAWPAGERYALALAPLAAPLRTVPPGYVDYVIEVRGQGDHFTPYPGGGEQDAELLARATRRGGELGIVAGARVLIDTARYADPVDWLLAPLVAGASVVLCARLDPDRLPARVAAEQVTLSLT